MEVSHYNPLPNDRHFSPAELKTALDEKAAIWRGSTCRKEFLELIDRIKPSAGWQFDKVVCLGTGRFANTCSASPETAMFQLVCVLDTAEALAQQGHPGGKAVGIFAQDPDNSPRDFAFLRTMGVEVVESTYNDELQKVNKHLGPGTMLFEWRIECGEQIATQIYEPAIGLRICSGTRFLRECPVRQLDGEPDPKCARFFLELADEFDAEHGACDFPQWHEEDDPFGQVIHWAKQH